MDKEIKTGICKHCGQAVSLEQAYETEKEADEAATLACDCPLAKMERESKQRLDKTNAEVIKLFGGEANLITALLRGLVELVEGQEIQKASITISKGCKAEISKTSKGFIRVKRKDEKERQTEF